MAIAHEHPAYESLRRWVADFRFPPGHKLKIELLADELRLSVTPVREALIRLADEDFIDFEFAKGFYIKAPTALYLRNQYEIIEFSLSILLERACDDVRKSGQVAQCMSEVFDEFSKRSNPARHLDLLLRKLYAVLGDFSNNDSLTRVFFDAVDRTKYYREVECTLRPAPEADIELVRLLLFAIRRGEKASVEGMLHRQAKERIEGIPRALDFMLAKLQGQNNTGTATPRLLPQNRQA